MKQLQVLGECETDGNRPELLAAQTTSGAPLMLDILLETNPIEKDCVLRAVVNVLPIQGIYDAVS